MVMSMRAGLDSFIEAVLNPFLLCENPWIPPSGGNVELEPTKTARLLGYYETGNQVLHRK